MKFIDGASKSSTDLVKKLLGELNKKTMYDEETHENLKEKTNGPYIVFSTTKINAYHNYIIGMYWQANYDKQRALRFYSKALVKGKKSDNYITKICLEAICEILHKSAI